MTGFKLFAIMFKCLPYQSLIFGLRSSMLLFLVASRLCLVLGSLEWVFKRLNELMAGRVRFGPVIHHCHGCCHYGIEEAKVDPRFQYYCIHNFAGATDK
jgi:hypothetical protein